jgi:hypothetical protein
MPTACWSADVGQPILFRTTDGWEWRRLFVDDGFFQAFSQRTHTCIPASVLDDVDQISTPLRYSSFSAYLELTGGLAAGFGGGQGAEGWYAVRAWMDARGFWACSAVTGAP